jgi:hypothetical protein
LGNAVRGSIGLAISAQVDMEDAVCELRFVVAGKPIQGSGQPLVSLGLAWTFEVLIQYCSKGVGG